MDETKALEYQVDRTGWDKGPWDSEPDRVDFEHAGYACLLLRNGIGAWCGYVGVGPEHPLHGKDYDDPDMPDVEVHGGLTYADICNGAICHVPKPGMPADVWWFGFDCAHYADTVPGMPRRGVYRDEAYARRQTEWLAEQLRTAETNR